MFLVHLPRGHGSADELMILMSSEGVLWQKPEVSEERGPDLSPHCSLHWLWLGLGVIPVGSWGKEG